MKGHDHAAHMLHTAPAHAMTDYMQARDAATPLAGGKVVRVELVAAEAQWEFTPGRTTTVWAYNGEVPGPVIEANVGDVLEVALTNRLPEATTLHWHGLRLLAPMDGTDGVQPPVQPGETFTYRFTLPDAGTFWYHPHMNETEQLERGLYGAIIVRGAEELQLDAERLLVLDDVKLEASGEIAPIGGLVERHDGRQGSTLLVNGRQLPEFSMAAGQVERWRVVNAASARYVRLSIGGRPFTLLGTDGGLIGEPVRLTELLLTPGDRAEIAVGPFAEGETIEVQSLPYDRRTIARTRLARWATVRVGEARPSRARIPAVLRTIEPLATSRGSATREIHFGVRPSLTSGLKFVVNGTTHFHDQPVGVGELQVWDLVNDTLMDHPFHLHGYFFQVIAVNGEAPPYLSWEDTVNLPPRSRVRIAWMPDDRTGDWMYHCHILEHHESGMMGHFSVVR